MFGAVDFTLGHASRTVRMDAVGCTKLRANVLNTLQQLLKALYAGILSFACGLSVLMDRQER